MASLPQPYHRLMSDLVKQQSRVNLLARYIDGNAPLPEGAKGVSAAYREFQKKARTNFAQLCIAAVRERMRIGGFRTGAEGDENGDREARRLWKATDLDVKAAEAHEWMLTYGRAFIMVGPISPFTGAPVVTAEHPGQMAVRTDPLDRRRVVSAVKVYQDENSLIDHAIFYEPDRISYYQKRATEDVLPVSTGGWDFVDEAANPLGVVPVVVFENLGAQGEFEPHLDILDRINHTMLQRLVIVATQAFKQRAIQGDLPEFDEQGNAIDYNGLFDPGPGALWTLPQGTSIWESGQTDLNGILQAIKHDIQDFAAVTRTPLHYLTPGGESQSAEGAALSREGLVFKTEDRINRVNHAWSQVMSLIFRYMGDDVRASLLDLEPMWQEVERYSLAERADAISKFTDVPFRSRMLLVGGFTPAEVDEMEAQRAEDQLLAGLFETPATPAPAPQETTPPEQG